MTPPLSGVSISTFGSISVLPIDVRKKAKNTNWPNYNCSLFISLFRKLSKHGTYRYRVRYQGTGSHSVGTYLELAPLHPAGDDAAPALNVVHMVDGHEEGHVQLTLRRGNALVHRLHQLQNGLLAQFRVGALQSRQRRALHNGRVLLREAHLLQQLSDLHLHQLDHFRVGRVALVDVDHEVFEPQLFGEGEMFPGLGHAAVGGAHHKDGPVQLTGS